MAYRPITDIWMLCRPKVAYYGAYPAGFLERARYLLGVTINDPVLHICGGRVREYQSGPMKGKGLGVNDRTVDLDPNLDPDYLLDVRRIGVAPGDVTPCLQRIEGEWTPVEFENTPDDDEGVWRRDLDPPREPYYACLIDRPYTEDDADEYAVTDRTNLPSLNDLLRRALAVTRIGGRVGVLDYYFPRPPRDGITLVATIGVLTGWGNRIRCFSVFERKAHNPLEHNVTGEKTEEEEEADTLPEPQPVDVATGEAVEGSAVGKTVVMAHPEDVEASPGTVGPAVAPARKKRKKKRPAAAAAAPAQKKTKASKKKLIKKKKKRRRAASTDGFE